MSTALLALTQGKTALTEAEILIMQEMQDDTAAFDMQPTRVKIAPGGIGQFLMGDDTAKTFTAIVAISQKIRGYWPGSGTGQPPLCSSPDGRIGYFALPAGDKQIEDGMRSPRPHPGVVLAVQQDAPYPDHFDCATCSMNQWSSEHQKRSIGKRKACKEMRRLLLLINGWALPALMSLPPTSLRAWDAYCSGLAAKRSAYFAVRTKFELDSAEANGGETYNIVRVSIADPVTSSDLQLVAEIRKQYRDLVGGLPIAADEYDTVPTPTEDNDVVPF
jgi:hypothetical protein